MTSRQRQTLLTFLLAILVLCSLRFAGNASAHAELVSTSPAAGSAEAAAPDRIELQFSETLELSLSSISLLSASGGPVELEAVRLDQGNAHVMSAELADPGALPAGVYTVVWGAYSAEDGHASTGSFTFSVGTGEAPEQIAGAGSSVSSWSVAGKWLELIGLVLLAGLAFFALTTGSRPERVTFRTCTALAGTALVGAVVSFGARVASLGGDSLRRGLDIGVGSDLLRSTYGHAWLVRVLLLLVAIAGALTISRSRPHAASAVMLGSGMLGLVTIAVSGHAGAVDLAWLGVLVDFLHMAAAAIWLGGLLGLLLVVSPAGDAPDDLRLLRMQGNRFAAAVVVIVLAGLAAASWHVGGRRSLQSTDYGRTLLVKVAIVVALLGVAYYNRRVLQGERGRGRWVPVAIGVELTMAIVILLFSADLSQSPPATRPLEVQVAARAIEVAGEATAGNSTVQISGVLTGDPTDEIAISVSPTNDLQRIIVHSTHQDSTEGATIGDRFDATQIGQQPGSYRFPAGKLGIAGIWQLEITVRRAGVEDEVVTLPVDTSGLATFGTRTVDDQWGGFRLTSHTALAIVMAGLMLVIGLGGLRRITGLEPLASGFLLAASILIAGGFLVSAARGLAPVTPDHALTNPVDTSPGALTYAGDLYQVNCAICHGTDGRGAGSSNLAHLHGNSADLTGGGAEAQSDGDLRYWIANGVAGTRMPAFGDALSEEEQWQLVLLIRQLQRETREAEASE